MTPEERLDQLEQENRKLREQLARKDEQIEQLIHQVQALQDRLSKNSHNSSLPPSSDRFVRQPKSLCKKSGKKPVQSVLTKLNPIIRGWANYFRTAVAKEIFHQLDQWMYCNTLSQTHAP